MLRPSRRRQAHPTGLSRLGKGGAGVFFVTWDQDTDAWSRAPRRAPYRPLRFGATSTARLMRRRLRALGQVGEEVVRVLDADLQAQEVRWAGGALALDRGVVLDQALGAARPGRPLP